IVAVDAVGSVIFGHPGSKRLIPGHGASMRPALYQAGLADECIHVSDWECVAGCHLLLSREALLVGGSSGATILAARRIEIRIPDGATGALLFPDRGERYLDTIFSDVWVEEQFGNSLETDEKLCMADVS